METTMRQDNDILRHHFCGQYSAGRKRERVRREKEGEKERERERQRKSERELPMLYVLKIIIALHTLLWNV